MDDEDEKKIRAVFRNIFSNVRKADPYYIYDATSQFECDEELDRDEILAILHYAYWAIKGRSIRPVDTPYKIDHMWDRLKEIISPIVYREMHEKGSRFESLMSLGLGTRLSELLSYHRLVDAATIAHVPNRVLTGLPGIGPKVLIDIRRRIPRVEYEGRHEDG